MSNNPNEMLYSYSYRLWMLLVFICSFLPSFADDYKSKRAAVAPVIDGNDNDACWATAPWAPMNQVWVPENGTAMPASDFTGHYKAVWREDKLYVLVRVTDDVLVNWYPNEPLRDYYKSDCPEIFLDENKSGGKHDCSYNAFAYHISTTYSVVDGDDKCQAKVFNDVLTGARTNAGTTYYWEFAINVFTDKYVFGAASNPKATLTQGKIMGWSIAYNDSDVGMDRERMYGSQVISPPDPQYGTNVSYINASYFGTMELVAGDVTTSLEKETDLENNLFISPNPSKDNFEVSGASAKNASLQLFSPQGKLVYENAHANEGEIISTVNLKPGVYILTLRTSGNVVKKKIIVE